MLYRTLASLPPSLALVAAAGCQTGLYQDFNETGETDTEDSPVVDTADTAPIDTDTELPGIDCHPADPIEVTGWTKTFSVTYQGAAGSETFTGYGADVTSTGVATFRVESHLTTASADLTSQTYRACGTEGEGLWEQTTVIGTVTRYIPPFNIPQATPVQYRRTPSIHEQYLPDLATLNGIGIWTYDYDLMIEGSDGSLFGLQANCTAPSGNPAACVPVSGSYTVFAAESVTVPAGTFTAYKLLDQRKEEWSQAAGGGGFFSWFLAALGMPGLFSNTDKDYVSWLYYVEGIGLVKEETFAASNVQTPLLTRELQSMTELPAN